MSRRPYHKRWHGDALNGYQELTLEERGAYTTLLDQMYDSGGPIRDDVRHACAWLNCDARVWKRIRHALVSQHQKLHAYTDEKGVSRLVNNRVQAELGLPTYDELVANLGRKLPIANGYLQPKSDETHKENNDPPARKKPKSDALLPLPLPEEPLPLSDQTPQAPLFDDDLPVSPQAPAIDWVGEIWKITPRRGRHRTSRQQIETAIRAAERRGHAPAAVLAGVSAYYASPDASKDSAAFAKGAHSVIGSGMWQSFEEDVQPEKEETDPWRRRLLNWKLNAYWNSEWGPRPDRPGYLGPALDQAAA